MINEPLPVYYEEPYKIETLLSNFLGRKKKSVLDINRYTIGKPEPPAHSLMQPESSFITDLIASFVAPEERLVTGILKDFADSSVIKKLANSNISFYCKENFLRKYSLIFESKDKNLIHELIMLSKDYFLLPFIFLVVKKECNLSLKEFYVLINKSELTYLKALLTNCCKCILKADTTDPYVDLISRDLKREDVMCEVTKVISLNNVSTQLLRAEW